ncbi:MAG: DUF192 domain-containing protein [Actinobacteria bacterium]|nr:DUF192 domain-containing protein [Actinomycetota bacterium]MBV9254627.1 DUF192 domain-containing protein [Actinomycetota bacterium]MBV9662553.1 DUF192 domain-containing protein [Actinomycetota bacterium]MBV9933060.1 DUF192 domain-containing protein [Actinomycetota bacterium]
MSPRLARLAAVLDTGAGIRRLWWLATALFVLGSLAFIVKGADGPKNPSLATAPSTTTTTAPPIEFGRISFKISTVQGKFCALLADTDARRERGLMGRTDLGGADAMVFTFPVDSTLPFIMNDVPVPLSIAWFDARGRLVRATDMETCPPDMTNCPSYAAGRPYRYAIEVLKGGLSRFKVGASSVLTVGSTC